MSTKLVMNTAEFLAELRQLPEDLRDDATAIVTMTAQGAVADMVQAYANVTGNLDKGVKLKIEASPFGINATVRSGAPHAHLYEYGTQARHTAIGANRGAMPARPTFIPIMVRRRRAMYEQLKSLMARAGLQVSGSVDG